MLPSFSKSSEYLSQIVFAQRNKDYGAYKLRLNYSKNLLAGLIVANVCFVGGVLLLFFTLKWQPEKVPLYKMVDYRTTDFSLEEIKIPKVPFTTNEQKSPPVKQEPTVSKPADDGNNQLNADERNKPSKELTSDKTAPITDESKSSPQSSTGENLKSYSADTTGTELYSNEIFMKVEVPAQFPGGPVMFGKFLADNIQYPEYARNQKVDGIIYVHMIVNNDGTLDDVRIYKGIEESCNNEVLRVIKLSPRWTPARQKGKFVRQRLIVPVHFQSP